MLSMNNLYYLLNIGLTLEIFEIRNSSTEPVDAMSDKKYIAIAAV